MEYNIDISYDIFHGHNRFVTKNIIEDIIDNSDCISYYFYYDLERTEKYKRNHGTYTIKFDSNNIESIVNFLYQIKKHNKIFLEVIYDSNIKTELLYASSYYLSYIINNKKLTKTQILSKNKDDELISALLHKNYFNIKIK